MQRFFLLRNNQESGPFTAGELRGKRLFSTDLVWVEDESTCWKHPAEFDVLKVLIRDPNPLQPDISIKAGASTASQTAGVTSRSFTVSITDVNEQEYKQHPQTPSFEALKKKYEESKPAKKKWASPVSIGANLFGLLIFTIGVTVTVFMVNKALQSKDFVPNIATAEAQLISSEILPSSTASYAAMAGTTTEGNPEPQPTVEPTGKLTNGAIPETAAKATSEEAGKMLKKATSESELKKAKLLLQKEKLVANGNQNEPENSEKLEVPPIESEPANEEKTERSITKSSITIAANDYKTSFLGGVSDLELSVTNTSAQKISKAAIIVEYLKPNGKVVHSETVEVSAVAPGASKKLAVPNSSRGVSVRYRVVDIEG